MEGGKKRGEGQLEFYYNSGEGKKKRAFNPLRINDSFILGGGGKESLP